MNRLNKNLEKIWQEVPVDYYQKGINKNISQRLWHRQKTKITLNLLKDLEWIDDKDIKLLDVGCASGWFLSKIYSYYPNLKCTGIDVYQKAIEYGKKIYPQISFLYGDAQELPFRNGSFDIIVCTDVLEHIVDPQKAVEEMKRVLKTRGVFIVAVNSESLLFNLTWSFWKKFKGKIWKDAHLHKFKAKDLDRLLKKTGFKIEKKRFFNLGMMVIYLLKKRTSLF